MIENINFKDLENSDINLNLLNKFNRFQKIDQYYKNEDDKWVLKNTDYSLNWGEYKIKEIISVFINALNNDGYVIGAYDNEKLIGFAVLTIEKFETNEEYMELKYIHVSLEYRHKGIGKQLFKICTERACKKNVKKIRVLANDPEETQRFFLGIGFNDIKEINKKDIVKYPNQREMEYAIK